MLCVAGQSLAEFACEPWGPGTGADDAARLRPSVEGRAYGPGCVYGPGHVYGPGRAG